MNHCDYEVMQIRPMFRHWVSESWACRSRSIRLGRLELGYIWWKFCKLDVGANWITPLSYHTKKELNEEWDRCSRVWVDWYFPNPKYRLHVRIGRRAVPAYVYRQLFGGAAGR